MATMPTMQMQVGVELKEPNWPLVCVALTGHAMRALGYLESGNADLALGALRDARGVVDLTMLVQVEFPAGEVLREME